jgi:hypothetical protein
MNALVVIAVLVTVAYGASYIQVGLVIETPEKDVLKCVNITDTAATGLTVLTSANLTLSLAGGSVCGINGVGCNFPKETKECFCKCQMGVSSNYEALKVSMNSECQYWAYYHLKEGKWAYAQTGPDGYKVTQGSVEGWRWDLGDKKLPPVYTFKQICNTEL